MGKYVFITRQNYGCFTYRHIYIHGSLQTTPEWVSSATTSQTRCPHHYGGVPGSDHSLWDSLLSPSSDMQPGGVVGESIISTAAATAAAAALGSTRPALWHCAKKKRHGITLETHTHAHRDGYQLRTSGCHAAESDARWDLPGRTLGVGGSGTSGPEQVRRARRHRRASFRPHGEKRAVRTAVSPRLAERKPRNENPVKRVKRRAFSVAFPLCIACSVCVRVCTRVFFSSLRFYGCHHGRKTRAARAVHSIVQPYSWCSTLP